MIGNFYLSTAARTGVGADPPMRYASYIITGTFNQQETAAVVLLPVCFGELRFGLYTRVRVEFRTEKMTEDRGC